MERASLAEALARSLPTARKATTGGAPLLFESDQECFKSRFSHAVAGPGSVFLGNPAWSIAERQAAEAITAMADKAPSGQGWLMIPTGGSSGGVRFARHDQNTIDAAVHGFVRHFGLARVNACGVLPLHHVSGLMAWMRCALTGGEHVALDWKTLSTGELVSPPDRADGWVLSLVPTQLERLLSRTDSTEWLRRFRIIFLGGAPAWASLLDKAARASLPISTGYGMTETAAMVTAVRPEEFQTGDRTSGKSLPHARVSLSGDGTITVTGESVFRGYYPDFSTSRTFATGDVGSLDESGRLRVLGRSDGAIITGGEKVFPAEVEAALRASNEFEEVAVIGLPHREWGSQVVAAFEAGRPPDLASVQRHLDQSLARFKHPKKYVPVSPWPLDASGKIRRAELERRVREVLDVRTPDP
ncbi:MAG TPA: AMP-binding protein [Candidatus Didemnitutus sp.]|nr:AMP-binding protein [Candidatus Didemnitutus sp.]